MSPTTLTTLINKRKRRLPELLWRWKGRKSWREEPRKKNVFWWRSKHFSSRGPEKKRSFVSDRKRSELMSKL